MTPSLPPVSAPTLCIVDQSAPVPTDPAQRRALMLRAWDADLEAERMSPPQALRRPN